MSAGNPQSRPTRTTRPLSPVVSPISIAQPLFQPIPSDFAGYSQQMLGDLGTNTDGWDAAFNVLAGSLDDDVKGLSIFDDLLGTLPFNDGDLSKTYFDPVDALLPGLLEDGDQLNVIVQNPGVITGTPTIDPVPDPIPVDDGGGLGDGGGPTDEPPPPYIPGRYIPGDPFNWWGW